MTGIQNKLFSLSDERLRSFNSKLIPALPADRIIGVSTPKLKALAKELCESEKRSFLASLPHEYFEENQLHAFLIVPMRYDEQLSELECFLPFIDNWATCDQLSPRALINSDCGEKIIGWLGSERVYTVRFGLNLLMKKRLFSVEWMERAASLDCSEYYVSTGVAWYFATAMAFDFERALGYLDRLDGRTRERTIRKSRESYRVTDEHKALLRQLSNRK